MTNETDGRTTLSCVVDLPDPFRVDDILAFHRRDPLAMAERIDGPLLQKGLMWNGHAARLTIAFGTRQATADLAIDGRVEDAAPSLLTATVQRMLGLTQPVEAFERCHRHHPHVGALIARHPGLRVPAAATPFEALTWAITGQQISVGAATSIRRNLIEAASVRHSGGLYCYPDADRIAGMAETDLRRAGFSSAKTQTLIALGQRVRDGSLPLESWTRTMPIDDIDEQLRRVRGIGPWTVSYALLRGFGWLDGSLHGDVAVRRGLQSLLGSAEKITEEQAKRWLADFSPWRALVAAHLWAWQSNKGAL